MMHLILSHILEIMNRKLHADLGFDSIYTMMTKKYGYSEASAFRRIDAAKRLTSVPEIAERLKCLESDAKKDEMTSGTKTKEILEKLEACNGFETRQILAQEFDMPIKIQDIVRPQKDKSVRLEITFSKEQFEELKQAKSFLSHVVHNGSWAEVITVLASKINRSKMGKPGKNKACLGLSDEPQLGSVTEVNNSKTQKSPLVVEKRKRAPISVLMKRVLFTKAKGCCQFISANGLRCGS